MSRLTDVLEVVSRSVNCNSTLKRTFEQIKYLEDELQAMDWSEYENLYYDGDEMVDLIRDIMDIDISDVLEDDKDDFNYKKTRYGEV